MPPATRWPSGLLPLPPGDEDLEMGWQLHPAAWAGDTRPRQDGRSRGGRSAGGPGIRDRGRTGAGAVGVRQGGWRGLRGGAPGQQAGRGDRTPDRHGLGRRDREVLRPAASGVSAATSRSRFGTPARRLTIVRTETSSHTGNYSAKRTCARSNRVNLLGLSPNALNSRRPV
jgi:hypothetical protein